MGRCICITDSHLGVILPSGDIWGSLESFMVVTPGGCPCRWVGVRGQGSGVLLDILRCTGKPQSRVVWLKMAGAQKLVAVCTRMNVLTDCLLLVCFQFFNVMIRAVINTLCMHTPFHTFLIVPSR